MSNAAFLDTLNPDGTVKKPGQRRTDSHAPPAVQVERERRRVAYISIPSLYPSLGTMVHAVDLLRRGNIVRLCFNVYRVDIAPAPAAVEELIRALDDLRRISGCSWEDRTSESVQRFNGALRTASAWRRWSEQGHTLAISDDVADAVRYAPPRFNR